MPKLYFLLLCLVGSIGGWVSCTTDTEEVVCKLTDEQTAVRKTVPQMAVIAHRGTCRWAPEGSEAAMRWARNSGAHYLECDLQRTKDGYLVIYHDDHLLRTTDVAQKYPERKHAPIAEFTLEELFQLDLGAWYNRNKPAYARPGFEGLDILTLEDVIKIAEGYRICRDEKQKRIFIKEKGKIVTLYEADPADNGNRPGIYPETKKPELYPGIESDLKNELERLGWYSPHINSLKTIATQSGRIQTGNTAARVVVQTFSGESLKKLREAFPRLIPFCFLVACGVNQEVDQETYRNWIDYAISHGAVIFGPCLPETTDELGNLLKPWMRDLIKEKDLLIHAYTFNTAEQAKEYIDQVDGFFTNETLEVLTTLRKAGKLTFYTDPSEHPTEAGILDLLGY